MASKKLSDYLGRHEKTKAVVKLTRAGQGAPAREQVRSACHHQCVHRALLRGRIWLALSGTLGGCQPHAGQCRKEATVSQVKLAGRLQSEPRTAGDSGVLAVVGACWLHPAHRCPGFPALYLMPNCMVQCLSCTARGCRAQPGCRLRLCDCQGFALFADNIAMHDACSVRRFLLKAAARLLCCCCQGRTCT